MKKAHLPVSAQKISLRYQTSDMLISDWSSLPRGACLMWNENDSDKKVYGSLDQHDERSVMA
eukprot:2994256-Prymnesium_polylepis.1